MLLYLFLLFSLFIALGSMNSINPESTEEHVAEGGNINLTCKYDGSIYSIQWYRQYQRSRPEFLLYITEGGLIHPTDSDFSAHINKSEKRVALKIISAKVTDSAVYYCALQPNAGSGAGYKLIFGRGTRLTVEPKDVSEPSYYVLGDGDPQVCLASDFSKHDANKNNNLFKGTEPVLMDNLYSQVAFLSKETENLCEEDGGSGQCEDKLEQDPMVNLMSMTVLGLRLLFLKTLVFNALMTFRLWVSQ